MSQPWLVSDEVGVALRERRPVVALESTIIAHGLPRLRNLAAAREFEEILRARGVTPVRSGLRAVAGTCRRLSARDF